MITPGFNAVELDVIAQMAAQELDLATYLKLRGATPDNTYLAHVATIGARATRILAEMREAGKEKTELPKEHNHDEPIQQDTR